MLLIVSKKKGIDNVKINCANTHQPWDEPNLNDECNEFEDEVFKIEIVWILKWSPVDFMMKLAKLHALHRKYVQTNDNILMAPNQAPFPLDK